MRQTMAAAIRGALDEALTAGSGVVILGESVGRAGGVAGTTAGLLAAHGPDAVRDLPVADRAMLGFALGLAIGGKRPVVELTSSGRLLACAEVLAQAASIASAGEFGANLLVRVPYGGEAGDRIDRAVIDMLASIDGLRVVCPSDAAQAAGLLRSALASAGPVVMLESRARYRQRADVGVDSVPLDRARELRAGSHLTLAGWGGSVATCAGAADVLQREGISAQVVDLVSLVPIDRQRLGAWVRDTGRLVVVHPSDGELAERVLRVGLDEAFLYLESPLAVAGDSTDAAAAAGRAAVTY